MTTYSKKYFNEETQKWEPLYSTEGRSAYETAKLAGGRYKCYCITYINTGLVLVNGAIYG